MLVVNWKTDAAEKIVSSKQSDGDEGKCQDDGRNGS